MTKDGFLKRWSEQKRAAAGSPEPEPDPAAIPDAASDEPETLSEAELAALTPIEAITAETPLGQYLRRGVPAVLRRAALRRAWTANPKIRDYLDEARDYAWDWNTPGGVPGSGVLGAGPSLADAARRVLDGPLSAAPGGRDAEQGATPSDVATAPSNPPDAVTASSNPPQTPGGSTNEQRSGPAPVVLAAVEPETVVLARRHGKATPLPMKGHDGNDPV